MAVPQRYPFMITPQPKGGTAMLIKILKPSQILISSILALKLSLSKPQREHLLNLVEGIIMGEANWWVND